MYSVLIFDDNRNHILEIEKYLESYSRIDELKIDKAASFDELDERLKEGYPDILISDIVFDGENKNGIEMVKERFTTHHTKVIFVTGYIEYCTRVYETEHLYFLTKPLKADDLYKAMDKALSAAEKDAEAVKNKYIDVKEMGKYSRILISDIIYAESMARKMIIHLNNENIETYMTVSEFMGMADNSFTVCHKSFIVNMDHITKLHQKEILMDNGSIIPVSQKKWTKTKDTYLNYIASDI